MFKQSMAFLMAALMGFAQETDPSTIWRNSSNALNPIQEFEAEQIHKTLRGTSLGMAAFAKSAPAKAEVETSSVYAGFFAMGTEGSRRYVPVLSLTNTSSEPIQILIEYFDRSGQPLSVPFRNPNGGRAQYFTGASGMIDPGAEVGPSIATDVIEPLRSGYIRVTSDAPESLTVKSFVTVVEGSRWGVYVHAASTSSFLPVEVGVENSPRTKQTFVSIVNPTEEVVNVALTPRRFTGLTACAPVEIEMQPGQQIWRSVQSLMPCVKPGEDNYNLNIEALDGEIVVQAIYDYGNLIYATAPVAEVVPVENFSSVEISAADSAKGRTRTAVSNSCLPSFDPLKPRLSSDEQTIELDVNFDSCNSDQNWIIKTTASWFHLVDSRDREVSAVQGAGNVGLRVNIDASSPRRWGGNRYGYIYVYSVVNAHQKLLARYTFVQPVPKT